MTAKEARELTAKSLEPQAMAEITRIYANIELEASQGHAYLTIYGAITPTAHHILTYKGFKIEQHTDHRGLYTETIRWD